MAIRIYILPLVTDVINDQNTRHPKYVYGQSYGWSAIDYGSEDVCICGVIDGTQADHDTLVLNTDVMSLPANLDSLMGSAAVAKAQTFLEGLNIPADWINTSRTFREVIKIAIGLFQFAQRWNGLTNGSSPFKEGMNLATRYNQMNQTVKTRLKDCFDTLGVDRTSLTATSSIREALIIFGQEFTKKEIMLAGEVL